MSCRGFYEGYLDDTFGKCFCSLLIDRIALSSQHPGLHEFDVGQRPAESLGPWTPFRFQKIGCLLHNAADLGQSTIEIPANPDVTKLERSGDAATHVKAI